MSKPDGGHEWVVKMTDWHHFECCLHCGVSKAFHKWMTKDRNAYVWSGSPIPHGGPMPFPCSPTADAMLRERDR